MQGQDQQQQGGDSYVSMDGRLPAQTFDALTRDEVARLNDLLNTHHNTHSLASNFSMDSDYPHFMESTHAWAVFADDPRKRANINDRVVGTLIIIFQLFSYFMFASEAIEDYEAGRVPLLIDHANCIAADFEPVENFE